MICTRIGSNATAGGSHDKPWESWNRVPELVRLFVVIAKQPGRKEEEERDTHLASADDVGGRGQHVDHLALALVPPLGAQHHVDAGSGRVLAPRVELVVGDGGQSHRAIAAVHHCTAATTVGEIR